MFEKKLEKDLKVAIANVTPGVRAQAFHKGQLVADINVGDTKPYYDLASLTKALFTSTLFMHMYEEKDKILEDKILKYLPWFFHPALSVRQLLTHTTGLVSWKPLYIHLDLQQSRSERWEKLRTLLAQEKPEATVKAQYSDLNFLILAYLLEQEMKASLTDLWGDIKNHFGLTGTHFHVDNKPVYDVSKYAPTEECPWRQRRLQGEVHDENCWALGGVSTHAGLFGTADDIGKWFLELRATFLGEKKSHFISQETLQTFWQRAIAKESGDWALGFMLPSDKNSTAGQYFSKSSIGHTGFTGTSFWYDPKVDLAVTILSNRVYYGRDNREAFNAIRMKIQDAFYQNIIQA